MGLVLQAMKLGQMWSMENKCARRLMPDLKLLGPQVLSMCLQYLRSRNMHGINLRLATNTIHVISIPMMIKLTHYFLLKRSSLHQIVTFLVILRSVARHCLLNGAADTRHQAMCCQLVRYVFDIRYDGVVKLPSQH